MHFHPQAAILTEIEIDVPVSCTGIPVGKIKDLKNHRLFIELPELGILRIDHSVESGRKHIVDRFLAGIILNTYRAYLKCAVLRLRDGNPLTSLHKGDVIFSPFGPDQVELRKPHYNRIAEVFQEHPHESDRLEVADDTYTPLIFRHRYLELEPFHLRFGSVGHLDGRLDLIDYIVHAHFHVFRPEAYPVLIVALRLTKCIVAIYVLHVGKSRSGSGI